MNQHSQITAAMLIDLIGSRTLQSAFNVQEQTVRKCARDNKFPAMWFHELERLGIQRGYTVPRGLFSFKLSPPEIRLSTHG